MGFAGEPAHWEVLGLIPFGGLTRGELGMSPLPCGFRRHVVDVIGFRLTDLQKSACAMFQNMTAHAVCVKPLNHLSQGPNSRGHFGKIRLLFWRMDHLGCRSDTV